ncbi:MAG: hypothetical protein IAF58_03205 [Leptolyngbya sp.]|nr:hypothetical protein [Candidatus Melainabacteria bacterium]
MTQVHDAYPEVDNYWTEGGPDVTNADYTTDWVKWGKTFTGNMRNWCRGITAWNLALDQEGKPNIGPFPCGGLVTIHSETKEITPSGQYFAIGHFSKHVKRDAYRVGSEGEIADLVHVAFENPNGDKILVVTNGGAARTISIRIGDRICDTKLDGDSVTTLRFQ